MSYIIIKLVKEQMRDKELPVILLNSQSEVMEFDTIDEAEEMRNRFEVNSDSGHRYILKKIGHETTQ
jgi:hypothetical protein